MNIKWSPFPTPLNEGVIRLLVPESAGVYLLWGQLKNKNWKYYYVGKCDNLKDRLLEHLMYSEPNPCIKNHIIKHINSFAYAEVGKKTDRACIEKFLYDYYSPECNVKDPGGTPILVNLP